MSLKVISHPRVHSPTLTPRALGSAESLLPVTLAAPQDPFPPVSLHAGMGNCAGREPELAQSRLPRKVC